MDIAKLYSPTTTLEIVNPSNNQPIGITINLHSPDSDEMKAVQREWQDKALKAKGAGFSAKDIDKQAVKTLVTAISSWSWADGLEWEGDTPENDESFMEKVLSSEAGSFIARQIDKALGDEARFFSNSVKT